MRHCLSHAPYWGPGPQPRPVPWLGIKLETLRFAGWHSIHWAAPARAWTECFHSIAHLVLRTALEAGTTPNIIHETAPPIDLVTWQVRSWTAQPYTLTSLNFWPSLSYKLFNTSLPGTHLCSSSSFSPDRPQPHPQSHPTVKPFPAHPLGIQ